MYFFENYEDDDYNWISCQSSTDSSDENESVGSDDELDEEKPQSVMKVSKLVSTFH